MSKKDSKIKIQRQKEIKLKICKKKYELKIKKTKYFTLTLYIRIDKATTTADRQTTANSFTKR